MLQLKSIIPAFALGALMALASCTSHKPAPSADKQLQTHAAQTLDSLYAHFGVKGTLLLREEFPFETGDNGEVDPNVRQYAYLWPYASTFAAVNALYEATRDTTYKALLDRRVLVGLHTYFDTDRMPVGYASYIPIRPRPDRYYDDNCWVGQEFVNLYLCTRDTKYLDSALTAWDFVKSGMDDTFGGGIYWCEQTRNSKNTCSNAPAAVLALKLFQATKDSTYLHAGITLYEWVKSHLQDPADHLLFDDIKKEGGPAGTLGKAKFAYNSGQMMQAAALLNRFTGQPSYLEEAQRIAESCYNYFFTDYTSETGEQLRMFKSGDIWFTAVMLRGYVELYRQDGNRKYIDTYDRNLEYAWNHARNENGLFNADLTGRFRDNKKLLINQSAMIEMYARVASLREQRE